MTRRDIFLQAFKIRNPQERAAFLDGACGQDASLRESVEALLAENAPDNGPDDAAATLKAPDAVQQDAGGAMASAVITEKAGDRIDRYKLLQNIGEGGCGVVYMAEQEEPVRRRVALKVIKLGMDTRQVVARFEAERQALALMDHPNIARVLDAGATDSGRPYFVMELVKGIRITDYCDQNRLTLRQRLDLFVQVCQAIQHAHQKGIIHRDIKPSNILVTLHDGVPVPKVIDFGIAKATDQKLTEKTLFTQFEAFIGTPAYMSPEQAEMSGLDIDTRTDIYALGVLLYQMLTGKTPFDGETLLKAGLDEMRRTIREKEPPRPSTRLTTMRAGELADWARHQQTDPPKLLHLVRGDLDWIVMKCLEKDRTRRYETANGLARDIERHLHHEPVTARPPSRIYWLQKMVRRNKAACAAAAAVALALVGGLAVATWQYHGKSRALQRTVAAEREQNRLREAAEAAANLARLQAYAADIRAAQIALNENNFAAARALLRRHIPARVGRDAPIAPNQDDLREFSWAWLWEAAQGDARQSLAHPGVVFAVAMSPDQRWLATSCFDGQVRIWDAATGRQHRQFTGLLDPYQLIRNIAFSPDGRWFVTGVDRGVVIRDTTSWEIVRELSGGRWTVAFSADGRLLAADSENGVRIYKTATWEASDLAIGTPADTSHYLAFAADGRGLFVASRHNEAVQLWDVAGRKAIREFKVAFKIRTLAVPDHGRWLVAGGYSMDATLAIWEVETGRVIATNRANAGPVSGLAVAPGGELLAAAGSDAAINLWRVEKGGSGALILTRQRTLRGHESEVWHLAFSADGKTVASAGKDTTACLWPAEPPETPRVLLAAPKEARVLGFTKDSRHVKTWGPGHVWELWDRENGRHVQTRSLPDDFPRMIPSTLAAYQPVPLFHRDELAVYGKADGTMCLWDLQAQRAFAELRVAGQFMLPVALSPDQQRLAVWDPQRREATLWNLEQRRLEAELPGFSPHGVHSVVQRRTRFSPDGRYLAYGRADFSVVLWDVASKRPARSLEGHRLTIAGVDWADNSRTIATGSWDGSARIWDVETGRETVPALVGHVSGLWQVNLSGSGRRLSTTGEDGSVRLWHVGTGKEMLSFPDVRQFVLTGSPDGHYVIRYSAKFPGRYEIARRPTVEELDARAR